MLTGLSATTIKEVRSGKRIIDNRYLFSEGLPCSLSPFLHRTLGPSGHVILQRIQARFPEPAGVIEPRRGQPLLDELVALRAWLRMRSADGSDFLWGGTSRDKVCRKLRGGYSICDRLGHLRSREVDGIAPLVGGHDTRTYTDSGHHIAAHRTDARCRRTEAYRQP